MSQKENLLEKIARYLYRRFILREKLVGACRVGHSNYEFWERPCKCKITGTIDGKPFKPVIIKKYKPIWTVSIEELMNHSGDIEEFLYTDDYKTYLENKNRLLASPQAQI